MMRFTVLFAAVIMPNALAIAQTPAGELPVDPYEISNDNAGADPFEGAALFEAFNGEAGISRVVDDMVDRILVDPRLKDIFAASDHVRLRRTLKEQFCFILNGPCDYTGRDMQTAHADHGITNREFNALIENLQLALDTEGVAFWAQNKLLAKLAPMQRDVVTR